MNIEVLLQLILIVAFISLISYFLSSKKKKTLSKEQLDKIDEEHKVRVEKRRIELENDKERVTKTEIRNLIISLKLPEIVLDLFDGTCDDKVIQRELNGNDYDAPYSILELIKKQQDAYLIDRYKPILAYNHATIFAYDSKLNGFITYDIEDTIIEKEECLSWDGLFIREILSWWEFEISDEDILHLGNSFGLKYTKEILESIHYTTDGKGLHATEEEKWKNTIIDKINARIR